MSTMRRHSKKRDAILSCIRRSHLHPSAEWIYTQLKPEHPDLSLGTVYRNLALFRESGEIVCVATVHGVERLDAVTEPHAHFICEQCDALICAVRPCFSWSSSMAVPSSVAKCFSAAFVHAVKTRIFEWQHLAAALNIIYLFL